MIARADIDRAWCTACAVATTEADLEDGLCASCADEPASAPFTAWPAADVAVPLRRLRGGHWIADGAPLRIEQYAHEARTVTDENGLRLADAEREEEAAALVLADRILAAEARKIANRG